MKKIFCREVNNAKAFLDGIQALKERGAVEASWMLATAVPGLGKSGTMEWYAIQNDYPYVRCMAGWSVHWMVQDIVRALQLEPKSRTQANIDLIVAELVNRSLAGKEQIILVDEINHAAKTIKVLETLRDITDLTQVMLVAGGHKGTENTLKAHKQIYSRISSFVEFTHATREDVKILFGTMCDLDITDCAADEILRQTGGLYREIMNTITRVEQLGKRNKVKLVSADIIGDRRLTNDGSVRGLRVVK